MTERPLNLAPQRGPSVWDRPDTPRGWTLEESERTCVALCGGTMAVMGALMGRRQRSMGGMLLAAVGGTLVVRALLGHRDLWNLRLLTERLRSASDDGDHVERAADDSFPASDPPSWTPTTAGAKVP